MKQRATIFTLLALICVGACKQDKTQTQDPVVEQIEDKDGLMNGNYKTYKGEFIYITDGAVLKGSNFIYGVKMDTMATILARQVEPAKLEEFDMVPVVVRGVVNPKPSGAEGWDEILTIKEIVAVSDTPAEADIKIEEKQQ